MSDEFVQQLTILGPALYRISWRITGNANDVEEILQDVAVEVMNVASRKKIVNYPGFLKRLTVCRSLDRLRRRRPVEAFVETEFASKAASPIDEAIRGELESNLRVALAVLPSRQAEVFSLRYFDDLSNPEIAAALGISTAAVATALRKSRIRLAELLSIEVGSRESK